MTTPRTLPPCDHDECPPTHCKRQQLKPCPFCGNAAEVDTMRGFRAIGSGKVCNEVAIYCTECSAEMAWPHNDFPPYSTEEILSMLTEEWNKRAELESLQKACAEKDKALERALAGIWDGHYSGKGVEVAYAQAVDKEVKHALSTDCGKEYVHISGQEKLANELDRVEDEYTKQLEAARQRIASLTSKLGQIQGMAMAQSSVFAVKVQQLATEALENKQG